MEDQYYKPHTIIMTNTTTQQQLETRLWDAANSSRGTVDAAQYKDYALAMLFFKYLSDKVKSEREELEQRYPDNPERVEDKLKLGRFYIPDGVYFDDIYSMHEQDDIGEQINKALHKIEESNREKLEGIFSLDFNSESILGKLEQRNKMLRDLIRDFNKLDLRNVSEDILGNAYMYMISKFAASAGKKAGEFFTRSKISELVAKLSEPKPGNKICDMACGSGGLLLLAGEEVRKQDSEDYALYGQEAVGATYHLCRMNMYLHGLDQAHIEWGDTINNPLLVENDQLMKFDRVVANPPFSLAKWGADKAEEDRYKRFTRGVPPQNKGDYAFILHMIETLKPKSGRGVIIVPHGVLFRGAAEGRIRKQLLEENIIDAVIGLPAGLFQTTGIPVAILIIDRSREQGGERETDKDVLFIEASKEFRAGKAQNHLDDEQIEKIFDTFTSRQEIEKYSRRVPISEIAENDYNLNITRYVDTFEEEAPVDIEATLAKIQELNPQIQELEEQMEGYLKKLGIKK